MMYYVIELDHRPDGVINSAITAKNGFASGMSFFHDRVSKGYASEQFTKVYVTIMDENNEIVSQEAVNTSYAGG